MIPQDVAAQFVRWLDSRVTAAGRGDEDDHLDVDPSRVFWLGRLAPEDSVSSATRREQRMDPCAIGIRLRPGQPGPWTLRAAMSARAWTQVDKQWRKSPPIRVEVEETFHGADPVRHFAADAIEAAFDAVGARGLSAEIRVEHESWRDDPELVVQVINTTPEQSRVNGECHMYEVSLEVSGLDHRPFLLESLPDSFRYDRRVLAYGINCGVVADGRGLRTVDTAAVERQRPDYLLGAANAVDLSFQALAADPLPQLRALVDAYESWGLGHWAEEVLAGRAVAGGWSDEMAAEARRAAADHGNELDRLRRGIEVLEADPQLLRAYRLMNDAVAHAANDRYDRWRPFQVGFLLTVVPCLVGVEEERDVVDTVWFATGGGKTETYLGLLVTAALHDRLRGKRQGMTAWSRFPLRMLSLQQTQRFADCLAGAELVRRREGIPGDPIALGYFVGATTTPNEIPKEPTEYNSLDVEDDTMPARFQILLRCPFCHAESLQMHFARTTWRLEHRCTASGCPLAGEPLPFYIVDAEIYRFLPTIVIGTLDKAALIGMQAAMRGLVGAPWGRCSRQDHGFTYAARRTRPRGCLVPDCDAEQEPVAAQERELLAPTLRLQDELHLLRDSLGAVDSHYETLLDGLQRELTGTTAKIIASSATLAGFERQVEVLYRRQARAFPIPGPTVEESFWTKDSELLLRRYVAVWPRGVTLEFVSDRTTTVLQQQVRRLLSEPALVSAEAGIDPVWAEELAELYGVHVIYGNTIRDVEAARRSLGTQVDVTPLNAVSLTGRSTFDEVRQALDDLQRPPSSFDERIHVVTASAMLSHGVDIDRLNVMVMLGMPLTTAEFIQTTARVGRAFPALVHVLLKVGRERDGAVFGQFDSFVRQGDRFVEPVPVTRRSRRVLELTLPGAVEARRLHVHEPRSPKRRLTTVPLLREYHELSPQPSVEELAKVCRCLGLESGDSLLAEDIESWIDRYFERLSDLSDPARWPNQLLPGGRQPMRSLRDVDVQIPISDD